LSRPSTHTKHATVEHMRTFVSCIIRISTYGIGIPYSNGIVIRCCGKVHAVWRPCNVRQAFCVPIQITDKFPGERRPYLSDVVGGFSKRKKGRISNHMRSSSCTRGGEERKGRLPQEASNIPSGLNLTDDIDILWPRSVCLSS
jgi:hypothetical protein